jgi:ribosomal protein S18 acetylase RimI-like enzyme
MIIRLANKKDAKQILSLYNNSENFNMAGDKKEIFELKDIEDYFNRDMVRIFVCEKDKKIIAAVQIIVFKTYIYFNLITVSKEHQEKGIGSKLLKSVNEFAKKNKIKCIEAVTETSNIKMQHLFEKFKYKRGHTYYSYVKE